MGRFKNSLSISGSKSLLKAFVDELHLLGYECTQFPNIASRFDYIESKDFKPYVWVNHEGVCSLFNSGKFTIADNNGNVIEKRFFLPQDWNEALRLAGEKEEEEWKVGDFFKVVGGRRRDGEILRIKRIGSGEYLQYEADVAEYGTDYSPDNMARVSPEEIEKHLLAEAEKKGFVKGAKVDPIHGKENTMRSFNGGWCGNMAAGVREITGYTFRDNELLIEVSGTVAGVFFRMEGFSLIPSHPQIRLGQYDVEFFDNHIMVGCTKVPLSTIEEIYNHFKKGQVKP